MSSFTLGDRVRIAENSSARRGLWNEVGRVTASSPGRDEDQYWILFEDRPTSVRIPASALLLQL